MANKFTFTEAFAKATKNLPADDFKAIMLAIYGHVFDGGEPDGFSSEWAKSIYSLMESIIDEELSDQQGGAKGGSGDG